MFPACLHQTAIQWQVPERQLETLYRRSPKTGIGPMHIPTAWLPLLEKSGFTQTQLRTHTCVNIRAAALILSIERDKNTSSQPAPGCLKSAAKDYHVSYSTLWTAFQKADGKAPSQGYGVMHIPGQWLSVLRASGFPEWRVKHDTCWNIAAAAWILSAEGTSKAATAVGPVNTSSIPNIPTRIAADAEIASQSSGVPAPMLLAVAWQESSFNPLAVSSKGAQGLMQFMPETWTRFGHGSPFNPLNALQAGARYLRHLALRFHSWKLAIAGYNAGGQAVVNADYQIPPFPQTQHYVPAVLSHYQQMAAESH